MVSDMCKNDLTTGNPFTSLLKFAVPVILGNLFQLFCVYFLQLYLH